MSHANILIAAVAISVVCLVVLSKLPQPSRIETADSPAALETTVEGWGPRGGIRAGFALGFDYLFMAAYVTAIGVGCFVSAEQAGGALATVGRLIAYAQIGSGLLDAFENAALLLLLLRGFDARLMGAARLATACKFVVPVGGMLYIAIAWVARRL